jgi:hypothetical protein
MYMMEGDFEWNIAGQTDKILRYELPYLDMDTETFIRFALEELPFIEDTIKENEIYHFRKIDLNNGSGPEILRDDTESIFSALCKIMSGEEIETFLINEYVKNNRKRAIAKWRAKRSKIRYVKKFCVRKSIIALKRKRSKGKFLPYRKNFVSVTELHHEQNFFS